MNPQINRTGDEDSVIIKSDIWYSKYVPIEEELDRVKRELEAEKEKKEINIRIGAQYFQMMDGLGKRSIKVGYIELDDNGIAAYKRYHGMRLETGAIMTLIRQVFADVRNDFRFRDMSFIDLTREEIEQMIKELASRQSDLKKAEEDINKLKEKISLEYFNNLYKQIPWLFRVLYKKRFNKIKSFIHELRH